MKVEYYIQFCSHWVRLYLDVWCFEDWDEDWAKKQLSEDRPLFLSRAEQIDREGAAFEDCSEAGSSRMVEMCQMVMMAGVGLRHTFASRLIQNGESLA